MPLGKTASVLSTDAMEVVVIPDAEEPDGPHNEMVELENDLGGAIEVKLAGDGIVVLENNLGAAIEVTLDQEMKVLYPQKSCGFDITRASDKLMKVHCRDDPSIFGTRRVEDSSTLPASESFGSFGVQVASFLQKEQEEVDREKSLLRNRKKRMTWELEKETRARLSILSFVIPLLFSCAALFLGLLVLWTCLDPEDYEDSPVLLCLGVVLSLAGLCISSFSAQTFGLSCSGPRQKKVGALWKLRLFGPGRPYCDHSHREVFDGWILVDRAGSWTAVLLHVYFGVCVVVVRLLREGYHDL